MAKKLFQIIFYNLFIFIVMILLVEVIFGGWFKKDNFGAYFREHRMKKVPYSIKYNDKQYDFSYIRNYHGFIGKEIDPSKIHTVFIGGSTADERWKPRNLSIVEQLNNNFKNDLKDIRIINAGIEGQSTIGYIANFQFWFPKLKNFKPKYFIFYTGVNDLLRQDYNTYDYSDGYAKLIEKNKNERLKDELKSKSFFYDASRKIKHKYYVREKKTFMDLDKSMKKYSNSKYAKKLLKNKPYNYLVFNKAMENSNMDKLIKKEKEFTEFFLKNIDILAINSKKYSAVPIFVNQTTAYGAHEKRHLALNFALKKHCIKKKYVCIDFANSFDGKLEYWYDGVHTTPLGSKVIADKIYFHLKKIIN
tara:strand:+ start:693 stop:1775 length:1083 start_codon:yes stop_codon:yes gene_type:complete